MDFPKSRIICECSLWERFYGREDASMQKNGGAGLGLALVKEWIEEMGGTVSTFADLCTNF
jgi:signal transduction histidine kinase